jgi:hypothetical protein
LIHSLASALQDTEVQKVRHTGKRGKNGKIQEQGKMILLVRIWVIISQGTTADVAPQLTQPITTALCNSGFGNNIKQNIFNEP